MENLSFKLKGNEYSLKFPTVGGYRRIQSLKQVLSSNTYSSLISTGTHEAQDAADMIDIEATLTVLCPRIIEDLKCSSFEDLGLVDYIELRKAYAEQVSPWWNNILKVIGSLGENE